MSSSPSITSITSTSDAEKLEPLEDFRLFTCPSTVRNREYWWGLEAGEIDFDACFNKVSVRGDIARLLSDYALTLVPSREVLDIMLEHARFNQKHHLSERRRCFDVLPIQPYTYRLIPGSENKQIPLFAFDADPRTFQRFDHPYNDLPSFTLDCYPFHAVIHSDRVASYEPVYNYAILDIARLWKSKYPDTGSFALDPYKAKLVAEYEAILHGWVPQPEDVSDWYGDDESSDSDFSIEDLSNTLQRSTVASNAANVVMWRKSVPPGGPLLLESFIASDLKDGSLDVSESRMSVS
ncbi:hypothetical protein F5050DRAFT_1809649 [Lentinula boryana]|uniref:HNH nuclease domain-containing protein n=1 Tax=Lentinula boryana TaxID=40481 RepID=A0ABQ8Q748_9AGAR|nr:hypothetical protein F5050DRAFT_1809649 [Lentinula boryana]